MTQMPPYKRGYRDGLRYAVTWLHRRANQMNDGHARQILDSAATNLGWEIEGLLPIRREDGGREMDPPHSGAR